MSSRLEYKTVRKVLRGMFGVPEFRTIKGVGGDKVAEGEL